MLDLLDPIRPVVLGDIREVSRREVSGAVRVFPVQPARHAFREQMQVT